MRHSKEDVQEIKNYVIRELVANYAYSEPMATELVNRSMFHKMLLKNFDFVAHYTVDYWANNVV